MAQSTPDTDDRGPFMSDLPVLDGMPLATLRTLVLPAWLVQFVSPAAGSKTETQCSSLSRF